MYQNKIKSIHCLKSSINLSFNCLLIVRPCTSKVSLFCNQVFILYLNYLFLCYKLFHSLNNKIHRRSRCYIDNKYVQTMECLFFIEKIHLVNLCERTSNNARRALYGLTESILILTTFIIIIIGLSSLTHVKIYRKERKTQFSIHRIQSMNLSRLVVTCT